MNCGLVRLMFELKRGNINCNYGNRARFSTSGMLDPAKSPDQCQLRYLLVITVEHHHQDDGNDHHTEDG